jgi:hypothetical protein
MKTGRAILVDVLVLLGPDLLMRLSEQTAVARYELFTAVTMTSTVFWVATSCSSEKALRIAGTQSLYLQGPKARNLQKQAESFKLFLF